MRLICASQQAVARGDMITAIAKMEAAVARNDRLGLGDGPWADLAELYCVQSTRVKDAATAAVLRRNGLNLLREHRCAARMRKSHVCALPDWRNESSRERRPKSERWLEDKNPNPRAWGYIPNPDLSPMCMAAYCGAGFQNDEDGERRGTSYDFLDNDEEGGLDVVQEDSANAVQRVPSEIELELLAAKRLEASAEKWCKASMAGGSK